MKKFNPYKWTFLGLAVAINLFIIVNSCINGTISSQESGSFSQFTANFINIFFPNTITDANFDSFAFGLRKLVGHFGIFLLNGIFTTLTFYQFLKDTKFKNALFILVFSLSLGLSVACLSEMIQIFTPDRYGTWGDIGIDFGGYVLGFGATFLILILAKYTTFKKEANN